MQKNISILVAVVALLVGGIFGFSLGNNNSYRGNDEYGMHRMGDGRMMNNMMYGTSTMGSMMGGMTAMLQGKTGDAFDEAFLREMIVHHEGAVVMAELALKNAKHQEIKDLSTAIIYAQNKEIRDMKAWLQAWYGIEQ